MRKYTLYKHTTPSNKVYIGITSQRPEGRWNYGRGYDFNTHFKRAIKKYGWNNIKHEIISNELTEKQAKKEEIKLIKLYDSTNKNKGYNVSTGGDTVSEETRLKIGRANKGKKKTEDQIEKNRKAQLGKITSIETRQKLSKIHKGHIVSQETRNKIGVANKNKKPTPLAIQNSVKARSKKVICVETGEIFNSIAEAQKHYNLRNICSCCKGKRKTDGGFHWEYFE